MWREWIDGWDMMGEIISMSWMEIEGVREGVSRGILEVDKGFESAVRSDVSFPVSEIHSGFAVGFP
jgi:hypothetical protein